MSPYQDFSTRVCGVPENKRPPGLMRPNGRRQ